MDELDATDIAKSMADHFQTLLSDPKAETVRLTRTEATMALSLLTGLAEILEEDARRRSPPVGGRLDASS